MPGLLHGNLGDEIVGATLKFDSNLVWAPMSGRGRIVSWCTFERDYYAGILPIPWETILVELEEGPLFISNPQLHMERHRSRYASDADLHPMRRLKTGKFHLPRSSMPYLEGLQVDRLARDPARVPTRRYLEFLRRHRRGLLDHRTADRWGCGRRPP